MCLRYYQPGPEQHIFDGKSYSSSGHTADTNQASVANSFSIQEVIMLLCLLYSMQALYQLIPKRLY